MDEVRKTRRCCRKSVSRSNLGRRGLSTGIGPWWRADAQEAVPPVLPASAAPLAETLPLRAPLLLVPPVTHLKAERRLAKGYIEWEDAVAGRVTSSSSTQRRPRIRRNLVYEGW